MPRAGGGTPWSAIQRAAASMLRVRYRAWNGPGPRRASASAAGPGSAGCATVRPVGMRADLSRLAALGQRCEVLDEEQRQRVARPQGRGLPAQCLAGRRLACAVAWVADVDATLAHLRHVGCEVGALHGDVAQSP